MEKQQIVYMEMTNLMRELFRVFRQRINEQNQEVKVTQEQYALLHAIDLKKEDVIQKDMAEMMGKDKSSILRLIDSLEEKDLIRRVTDKNDRRKNYLMVTKQGHRMLDYCKGVFMQITKEIEEGLTEGDIENMHRVVMHLRSRAEKL